MPLSRSSDPWSIDAADYPRHGTTRQQLWFLLRYALLAPSPHNTQPWRFRVEGDEIEVWIDSRRELPRIDPRRRQLFMSVGAALFHLRLAVRCFGARDVVEYRPDRSRPDLLARVRRGAAFRAQPRDHALLAEIPRRRTYRGAFSRRPVSAFVGDVLAREVATEGAWMVRLHPHDKLDVAYTVGDGDRALLGEPSYRDEVTQWLTPRGSSRRDGIPMARKDVLTAVPLVGPALARSVDRSDAIARHEERLAIDSPILAVLGTDHDEPGDWLVAGEAMEAALLRASALELGASFLNQAIELPALRRRIAAASHHLGHAQLVLRFGWAPRLPPTPRHSLDDVLM